MNCFHNGDCRAIGDTEKFHFRKCSKLFHTVNTDESFAMQGKTNHVLSRSNAIRSNKTRSKQNSIICNSIIISDISDSFL